MTEKRNVSEWREFTVSIAREAGTLLKERFHRRHHVSYKGAINLVTEADLMSEKLLISRIRSAFPGHDIVSEESEMANTGSPFRWIIDPLDGTTNYAHGFPMFCVSIALEKEGVVITGVVYNPMLDELFVAEKGEGAYLNGTLLAVSDTDDLSQSFLATGFPYDIRENPDNNVNYFSTLALRVRAIRRAGAAALDLAYLAAGRFDGFWELRLQPWDTAAACLMVEEAGGTITDLAGGAWSFAAPGIMATNGKIHQAMIETLGAVDPMDGRVILD